MVHKKPSTIKVMIDRLMKSGFVLKIGNKNDKRVTKVFLTEKGKYIKKKLDKRVNEEMEIFFSGINYEEMIVMKNILRKIKNNLEKY